MDKMRENARKCEKLRTLMAERNEFKFIVHRRVAAVPFADESMAAPVH